MIGLIETLERHELGYVSREIDMHNLVFLPAYRLGKAYPHGVANGAYTMPFNLSGHPAVVIPIGQTQNQLPIGMQIGGKRWREIDLLAIAQEIDKAIGAFKHPPRY